LSAYSSSLSCLYFWKSDIRDLLFSICSYKNKKWRHSVNNVFEIATGYLQNNFTPKIAMTYSLFDFNNLIIWQLISKFLVA
jgi:hypothetical protein